MLTPYAQKPNSVSKSASSRTSPSTRSALRQMSPNRRHAVGPSTAEQGDNDTTDASAISSMQTSIPMKIFSLIRHLHRGLWQEQVEFLMKTKRIQVSYERTYDKKNRGIYWTDFIRFRPSTPTSYY
ncbi:hypothetical protein COCMIDRAFT_34483 [Bipolaris oryzae ATCC 44560]|uniref:Uncharacterized protein n=1 Tax=Bipolaris oryzae ATCC 44560 TaxID=930090 RepID=W6Z8P0_COCMI|nr:uncharacterized protein COCMIDRAFT_34483 [Bipolaris oryzae ATCC 44560]EUC48092.1 hypothetical protein COCMIDRAFT_34483 [Bipolaris oryzae ATCC 44560]